MNSFIDHSPHGSATTQLENRINQLVGRAYFGSTMLNNYNAWKRFSVFPALLKSTYQLPIPRHMNALYVVHFSASHPASSVSTILSVIAWKHKINALDDPTKSVALACKVKLPNSNLLDRIVSVLSVVTSSSYEATLLRAVFCLTFQACL